MGRKPVIGERVSGSENPRIVENAESYYNKTPSWRFSRADTYHPAWTVKEVHEDVLSDPEDSTGTRIIHEFSKSIDSALLDGLSARELMTWGALLTQNGGRGKNGGTNSHPVPIKDLIDEAQSRAAELNIVADELVSLRLDAKKRVFGILEGGVFSVIWFDREHKICPSRKN